MKQIRIISLIIVVAMMSFLASCSSASPGPVYEKEIDLSNRAQFRAFLERLEQTQFALPLDEVAADVVCRALVGEDSFSLGMHPEKGPVCATPEYMGLKYGTQFCRLTFGPKYFATKITGNAGHYSLFCALKRKRI